MKDLVLKTTALAKGIERLGIDFKQSLNQNIEIINKIETREIESNQGLSQSVTSIKTKFGELFYGSLCPINGVGSKNRRYHDKSWKTPDNYEDARALQGPVVWKKIGTQRNYSSRVQWYDTREVFDRLTSEHIDLVIDGLRNRKDQRSVAKDLLNIRDNIKNALEDAGGIEKTCMLNKAYPCELVLMTDAYNGVKLPSDLVPAICEEVLIDGEKLTFYFKVSSEISTYLKDTWDIDINGNNYYYGSQQAQQRKDSGSWTLNILDKVDINSYYGDFSYNKHFIPTGVHAAYSDSAIDKFFNESVSKKKDAIDLIEDAQSKYAPRLLMKGAF